MNFFLTRTIKSFSHDMADEKIFKTLDIIARRENKDRSKLIMEAIKIYTANHKDGNAQITLDIASKEGFIALPTMVEPLTDRFASMNNEEFFELAKAARGRSQEIAHEMRKRRLDENFRWTLD